MGFQSRASRPRWMRSDSYPISWRAGPGKSRTRLKLSPIQTTALSGSPTPPPPYKVLYIAGGPRLPRPPPPPQPPRLQEILNLPRQPPVDLRRPAADPPIPRLVQPREHAMPRDL